MNPLNEKMNRIRRFFFSFFGVTLLFSIWGFWLAPGRSSYSFLVGYLFWLTIPLGCLGLLMLQYVTSGRWGLVSRNLLRAASRTLPLFLLLAIPILLCLRELYPWARPELVLRDSVLQYKAAYLNVPFFTLRLIFYFLLWGGLVFLLHHPRWEGRRGKVSAAGMILLALTLTFASFDWLMSLDPHWYSTIFGFLFITDNLLSAVAFIVVLLFLLRHTVPFSGLQSDHFHDFGNLLLAFTLFWTYLAFSQFLIVWYGNLAEEVTWYIPRMRGGWGAVALLLLIAHFFIPFCLLLSRRIKRHANLLVGVAGLLLLMRLVDFYWHVLPAAPRSYPSFHWMDIVVLFSIGFLWGIVFVKELNRELSSGNEIVRRAAK